MPWHISDVTRSITDLNPLRPKAYKYSTDLVGGKPSKFGWYAVWFLAILDFLGIRTSQHVFQNWLKNEAKAYNETVQKADEEGPTKKRSVTALPTGQVQAKQIIDHLGKIENFSETYMVDVAYDQAELAAKVVNAVAASDQETFRSLKDSLNYLKNELEEIRTRLHNKYKSYFSAIDNISPISLPNLDEARMAEIKKQIKFEDAISMETVALLSPLLEHIQDLLKISVFWKKNDIDEARFTKEQIELVELIVDELEYVNHEIIPSKNTINKMHLLKIEKSLMLTNQALKIVAVYSKLNGDRKETMAEIEERLTVAKSLLTERKKALSQEKKGKSYQKNVQQLTKYLPSLPSDRQISRDVINQIRNPYNMNTQIVSVLVPYIARLPEIKAVVAFWKEHNDEDVRFTSQQRDFLEKVMKQFGYLKQKFFLEHKMIQTPLFGMTIVQLKKLLQNLLSDTVTEQDKRYITLLLMRLPKLLRKRDTYDNVERQLIDALRDNLINKLPGEDTTEMTIILSALQERLTSGCGVGALVSRELLNVFEVKADALAAQLTAALFPIEKQKHTAFTYYTQIKGAENNVWTEYNHDVEFLIKNDTVSSDYAEIAAVVHALERPKETKPSVTKQLIFLMQHLPKFGTIVAFWDKYGEVDFRFTDGQRTLIRGLVTGYEALEDGDLHKLAATLPFLGMDDTHLKALNQKLKTASETLSSQDIYQMSVLIIQLPQLIKGTDLTTTRQDLMIQLRTYVKLNTQKLERLHTLKPGKVPTREQVALIADGLAKNFHKVLDPIFWKKLCNQATPLIEWTEVLAPLLLYPSGVEVSSEALRVINQQAFQSGIVHVAQVIVNEYLKDKEFLAKMTVGMNKAMGSFKGSKEASTKKWGIPLINHFVRDQKRNSPLLDLGGHKTGSGFGDKHVIEAKEALMQFVGDRPQDQRWLLPIQVFCSQFLLAQFAGNVKGLALGLGLERADGTFFLLADTGHVMKAVAKRDDNGNITSVRITTVSKLAFASRSLNHPDEPEPIGGA